MRFCSASSMMSCTSLAVGLASGDFETHLHQQCKSSKLLDHSTLRYVQEAAKWSAVPPLCDDALCKHHGLSNKHLCWDSLSLESPLVTATIAPQNSGNTVGTSQCSRAQPALSCIHQSYRSIRASISAGHSSGTLVWRSCPRRPLSWVTISHSTTPKL